MTDQTDLIKAAVKAIAEEEMKSKKWYTSKTVWVNAVTLFAAAAQAKWGIVMPIEYQLGLVSIINVGLRAITKQNIEW